jgi:uncharacterized protein (DUF433 family)
MAGKGAMSMASLLAVEPQAIPLTRLEDGTYRITGTRIPLERVIECYKAGLVPEEIVDAFDTLRLSDVYAIIAYYLTHREQVEEYVRKQEEDAEEIRRMIEKAMPPRPGFREELLRRKALRDQNNAEAGH